MAVLGCGSGLLTLPPDRKHGIIGRPRHNGAWLTDHANVITAMFSCDIDDPRVNCQSYVRGWLIRGAGYTSEKARRAREMNLNFVFIVWGLLAQWGDANPGAAPVKPPFWIKR